MSSPINRSLIDSHYQRQNSPSPSKNDIDFLSRKIKRLQEDYHDVSQELQKVRARLRKAEDFEIKFELLTKQKLVIQNQLISKDHLIVQLKNEVKELEILSADKKNLQLISKIEKQNLNRQIEQWRLKYFEVEEMASKIKAQQQYKMSQKLIAQLQLLKKNFSSQQDDYKNKIRILQIKLSQKQTVESVLKQKNQKTSSQKQKQIQRLQENLTKARNEHLQYVEDKNSQMIYVASKFEKLFTIQIQKLKQNQSSNSEKFSLQVQGLRSLIQLKNAEIQQLIKQMGENRNCHQAEKNQLLNEISLLKDKLYQRERQNQIQLYNLKQRLITLHQADTNNIKSNYQKLNLNLEQNNEQLEKIIRQKDRQIFQSHQNFQQKQKALYKIIEQRDLIITQQNDKMRFAGELNAKQMDSLHSSFHKITSEKGQLSTEYQKTFDFLNNQITKLTHSNELKNQQIKDLHQDLAENKKNFSQHIKDLQKKWRAQRKQREQQRDRERGLREQLQDQFRQKQQKWRSRERNLQKEKQKEQRQKLKLKITVQQLQKNIQRLMKHIKQNQQKLRFQMQKSQTTFVEAGSIRRQLTAELQRQKNQLQSMKKMQLDQIQRQFEIQITRLTNENQKLQNQLTQLKINFDKLDQEYKKVKNTNKNIDRISKQKMVQYERKMTALNAEINLTQNLYQSFINAKSRVVKKDSQV